ncbi:hypothetical protein VUR80DRAFT_9038 [Thermomyces stellatus]
MPYATTLKMAHVNNERKADEHNLVLVHLPRQLSRSGKGQLVEEERVRGSLPPESDDFIVVFDEHSSKKHV